MTRGDTAASVVEIESGINGAVSPNTKEEAAAAAVDTINDAKDEDFDIITLPESTHTLLFTEPINSRAFQFSVAIATLSIMCLFLALFNSNYTKFGADAIPANVGNAVKTAQYASIFIALLMEEEIPTGLYLLRRISKTYFKSKFPELCYHKFVHACILRIFMGYLFLVNVFFIIMQARRVLDIFFDFIALQFLQQLDDIAFNLARMGVFSRSLRVATNKKYFRTEFKKEFNKAERSRRLSFFLVSDECVKLFPFFCDKCRCSLTYILAENTVFHQFDCFVEWTDLCNHQAVKGRLPMQIDKCNNQRGSVGGEYCARS